MYKQFYDPPSPPPRTQSRWKKISLDIWQKYYEHPSPPTVNIPSPEHTEDLIWVFMYYWIY